MPRRRRTRPHGGTTNLVGTELFREFREVSPKVWKGKVFVPDLNKVLTGTGTVKDHNTIVARGCLFAGMGCRVANVDTGPITRRRFPL